MARQHAPRSRRWLRRISIGLAVLVLAAGAAAAGWIWMHGYALSAGSARLVYDDLERFDAALARLPDSQDGWPGVFDAHYLAGATRGLNTYAKTYDVTGERLARMIAREPGGWQACRLTDHIRAQEPAVRRALEGFERVYPRAVFPPVSFVAGGERAGGMNGVAGVMIGAELYRQDRAGCGGRALVVRPSSEVPCIVVHELVHFNHAAATPHRYFREWSNLARAIKEGSADFVAELAAGCHINARAHEWGRSREAELWAEFQQVLDSRETGDWFWVEPEGERPADLGYFVGYNIVRAFYDRTPDKAEAVRRILTVSDYRRFLAESGYTGGR
jgi:hypothetical protein